MSLSRRVSEGGKRPRGRSKSHYCYWIREHADSPNEKTKKALKISTWTDKTLSREANSAPRKTVKMAKNKACLD